MAAKSNALENAIIDFWLRGQALVASVTTYVKLISCDGKHAVSAVYTLNDLIGVECDDSKWRLYKVTTAGTGAGAKTSYPGVANEAITDGTAVLTEQNAGLEVPPRLAAPMLMRLLHFQWQIGLALRAQDQP